jgi:hypothetical protein
VSIMVFHSTGRVHWPNFIKSYFEEKFSGSNTLAYFTRVLSDGKIKKIGLSPGINVSKLFSS